MYVTSHQAEPILSAAVAAGVLVVLMLLAYLVWRRRRRQEDEGDENVVKGMELLGSLGHKDVVARLAYHAALKPNTGAISWFDASGAQRSCTYKESSSKRARKRNRNRNHEQP